MADLDINMHYTYVLWSEKSKRFYIGYTSDLERRLSEHQNGKNHTTARMDHPKLIFYEGFVSENDARRREEYFKTAKGKKALRLIARDSISTRKQYIIQESGVVPIV